MKWGELLKKSWGYFKQHRSLWYLGILAALTEGGIATNFGGGNSDWKATQDDFPKYGAQAEAWVSAHFAEVALIALALFIISIIILYISYSARAGLIHSVIKLDDENLEPEFHRDFHTGQKYFWQFLGLTILITLIMLAVGIGAVAIVAGVFALSFAVSLWFLILAIPVTLALILGLIAFSVYMNAVLYLAYRVSVIEKKRIVESIRKARELIHHNFAHVILAWLIHAAFNTAFAVAMVIAGLVVIGILTAIGFGLYYGVGTIATWVYGVIVFIVLMLTTLVLSGGFNAYFSIFWTLVYKKLSAPK